MTRVAQLCAVVFVVAALFACGCTHQASSSSYASTRVGSDGSGSVEIDGVRIEFTGAVAFRLESVSAPQGSTVSRTIEGHEFGVRDGAFFIGERVYGKVASSSTVAVTPDGVTINGEPRGSLPPKRTD